MYLIGWGQGGGDDYGYDLYSGNIDIRIGIHSGADITVEEFECLNQLTGYKNRRHHPLLIL